MLDLRLPIGWYFIINAALLLICGVTNGQQSLVAYGDRSINLNLTWGAVMGVFGLIMAGLSYADKSKSNKPKSDG